MARKKNKNALEEEIGKPIRPQIIWPLIGPVPTDLKTIEAANAETPRLEAEAIEVAWQEKLQLLLRRYSLADGDWYGLALALAIAHEPGFRVESQLVQLTPGFWGAVSSKCCVSFSLRPT